MKKLLSYILFLFLITFNIAYAEDSLFTEIQNQDEFDSIIQSLEDYRKTVTSFESTFNQTRIILPFMDEEKAQGNFFFLYPDKVIWEFKSPEQSKIIVKGNRGYIISDDLKQVQVFEVNDSNRFDFLLAGLSKPLSSLFDNFEIKCFKGYDAEGNEIYYFVMIPTSDDLKSIIKEFELVIDVHTKNPVSSKLTELNGDVTEITFENMKVNGDIKKSFFEYKIPTDYDVIDYY